MNKYRIKILEGTVGDSTYKSYTPQFAFNTSGLAPLEWIDFSDHGYSTEERAMEEINRLKESLKRESSKKTYKNIE